MEATRRSILGGAGQIGALLGLVSLPALASTAPSPPRISDAEFIRSIGGLHDNGALAARHAIAAGMKPEWLFAVMLGTSGIDDPRDWPALLFGDGEKNYRFRPTGLDH